MKSFHLDNRRTLVFPGNATQTVEYCVNHWVETAKQAIDDHDFFAVALSGGSTPKKIFKALSSKHQKSLDWSKVHFFWSDERSVPPNHPDSNFHMAMIEGGLCSLPIDDQKIHRMEAEKELEGNANAYGKKIKKILKDRPFDLIMLGMGDDGHTASLFPGTKGINTTDKLVIPNYVNQKETWRMSFTYSLINSAKTICLYVLGEGKADILHKVLFTKLDPNTYPSQNVGSEENHATWIIDDAASQKLLSELK
ncbi:MAG: 6-phosphogluconolactonase [Chlamydiales bacterium]|nr:6-phosphogluconolactonase [Chlamydiales bacterium]MCH9620451.1 6-phosphogluconolactonase [Chlamydiales bacterium]MCH9623437.1 6-phosphogluconolactonase [Chlamydiales bacterium]